MFCRTVDPRSARCADCAEGGQKGSAGEKSASLTRSISSRSIAGDPITQCVQEITELERFRQVKLTIGFEFRHVREAARYEEIRHPLLLCGVHRGERRPIREKHIGNEQIDFYPFEKLSRITDASVVLT